ncbi:hypothetical protein PoB_002235800 [Plakobranchus ocellatus]|uniref:C-type lectin domain-containing protein n=1 Tax=Plakobranchus ocellatus TaxID=259542 RepID=A0AAV3ZLZ2_9GAST|nr:hypothetical protein PoB_002235800 [Plakobranchus ocellatus]
MYPLYIFLTFSLCAFAKSNSVAQTCPDDVIRTGSKYLEVLDDTCYQFFPDTSMKKSYWEAESACAKLQGTLVMPKTKKINQFIVDTLLKYKMTEEVFIGLNNKEDRTMLRWSDGELLTSPGLNQNFPKDIEMFRPWKYTAKKPSTDCVTLNPVKNTWQSIDCQKNIVNRLFGRQNRRLFICEFVRVEDKDGTGGAGGGNGSPDLLDYLLNPLPQNRYVPTLTTSSMVVLHALALLMIHTATL